MFFTECYADDDLCMQYKKNPNVKVNKAVWNVNINASKDDLWPKGGFVTISPFGSFAPQIGYMFNGKYYCVFLESVDATIGFKDFDVVIDRKYPKGSCEYNAILEHEKHHIADSEKALDVVFPGVDAALRDAADNILPIYVENVDDVPVAAENIQNQIVENKKLKELVDKFKQQQIKDADALDGTEDEKIKKCTKDKVDAAFEKYFKKKGK